MKKVLLALAFTSAAPAFSGSVSGGGGLSPAKPAFKIEITEDQLESTLLEAMRDKTKIKPIQLEVNGQIVKLRPRAFDFMSRTISAANSKGEIGEIRQMPDEEPASVTESE